MRGLFLIVMVLIVVPADLILLRGRAALWQRALVAMMAIALPIAIAVYIDRLPQFSNNSPEATQAMRLFGLALTALGGLIPWALAVLYLRRAR